MANPNSIDPKNENDIAGGVIAQKARIQADIQAQIDAGLLSRHLGDLIMQLPEIYQPIYSHPEISIGVSRESDDRWAVIRKIYLAMHDKLGRSLKVLDLGCAQGYMSLRLSAEGASVTGVDYLDENIAVCNAVAAEHRGLNVRFETKRVEDLLGTISVGQYDMVLGLSIFHHLIHLHGKDVITGWLTELAPKIECGIFEFALSSEPIYWAPSQPPTPRDLLSGFDFVHEIARYGTHLSEIERPLYYSSNRYWYLDGVIGSFEAWTYSSHHLVENNFQKTRQYFFGNGQIIKKFLLDSGLESVNRIELKQESNFLSAPPPGLQVPHLILAGENQYEVWLVREAPPGKILSTLIKDGVPYDPYLVLADILEQLCILEAAGLYHNDIRTWNTLVLTDNSAMLLDYGSIIRSNEDCVWPHNIYLAFWIFVYEVVSGTVNTPFPLRQPFISPISLPEPYQKWGMMFWSYPTSEWSFKLLQDGFKKLVENKNATILPKDSAISESGSELWVRAMDEYVNKFIELHENLILIQSEQNKLHAEMEQNRAEKEHFQQGLESTRAELESTRGELESTRGELESTRGELESTRGELEFTQAEMEYTRSEMLEAEANLSDTKNQLASVSAEKQNLKARLDAMWLERERFRLQVEQIYASRSYRIAAPLRWATDALRASRANLRNARTKISPLVTKTKIQIRRLANWLKTTKFGGFLLGIVRKRFPGLWKKIAKRLETDSRIELGYVLKGHESVSGPDEEYFVSNFNRGIKTE
ncbi:MAG: methyltransferase domain-containing protein [Chloroflexi bacterium]|nr:MAG: methyltransferase domain-containing protein [Chloroflexota bacterium]